MPLDVLVPHLVLPEGAPPALRALRLPALERWVARAEVAVAPERTAEAWLATRYALASPPPVAAVSLAADDAPREGAWLRADPVHFRIDRDAATLHHPAMLDIARDEADALVGALQAHFRADALEFVAPASDRWYVRVPGSEVPATVPLEEALGGDVLARLPRGPGHRSWPGAFTEAQMLLGAHPVNAERESHGEPAVNGIWFWGEGTRPAALPGIYARIASDDAFARGLGTLSGAALQRSPATLVDIEAADEPVLVTFGELARHWHRGDAQAWQREAQRLDGEVFAALGETLARFGEIRLVLPSARGTRVASLTRAARWRWFRRGAPLHA